MPLHLLITAGPTREAIDPVRFLSNRSSGRMGFALAQAAAEAGHVVTLVAGPVALPTPAGVVRVDVTTAAEMAAAVQERVAGTDVAIFAAAVADYRPVAVASQKLKKNAERLVLELERTTDILGSMRAPWGFRGVLVGFAAETEAVVAHAVEKMRRKGCDLLVANDVSRPGTGFDAADNEVALCFPSGVIRPLARAPKVEIAREVVTVAVSLHAERSHTTPDSASMPPSHLEIALAAARAAGALQRENLGTDLLVDDMQKHDIKLNLDVRCQKLIEEHILSAFPDHAVLGEEGSAGTAGAAYEWIVDPIDGTVNFFYGIPHFCVSIALRHRGEIILGVIYDPNLDEAFTVEKDGPALLNGRVISVSRRDQLADAVITVGFSKTTDSINAGGQRFLHLAHQVRKTRMLGSAALAMAYIACGRLDAYIEESISLWDVAAGMLLIERAGGTIVVKGDAGGAKKFSIVASNGRLSGLV